MYICSKFYCYNNFVESILKNERIFSWVNDANEKVKKVVRIWLKRRGVLFFFDSLKKLAHHWRNCVVNNDDGNYR